MKKKKNLYKAVKGEMRKKFFEEGNDLANWRGKSSVIPDKKKLANKRKCRKKDHEND